MGINSTKKTCIYNKILYLSIKLRIKIKYLNTRVRILKKRRERIVSKKVKSRIVKN